MNFLKTNFEQKSLKMKKTSLPRLIILTLVLFSGIFSAQNISGSATKIVVSGTSPMHNWIMSSSSANFSGTVSGNTITNVKFSMAVKNLKSEKGKMMDNKAYNALKADKNPDIYFSAASLNIGKSTLAGKLAIAGVTRNVTLPVNVVKNGTSYNISVSESLKMSDFGMEAPGFLGVRAGDVVTVTANITAN